MKRIPYVILAATALIRGMILSLLGREHGYCWNWAIFPLGDRRKFTTLHIGLNAAEAREMYERHRWVPLVYRTINGLPSREFLIEQTDEEIELGNAMCAAYVEYANMVSQEMAGVRRGGDTA